MYSSVGMSTLVELSPGTALGSTLMTFLSLLFLNSRPCSFSAMTCKTEHDHHSDHNLASHLQLTPSLTEPDLDCIAGLQCRACAGLLHCIAGLQCRACAGLLHCIAGLVWCRVHAWPTKASMQCRPSACKEALPVAWLLPAQNVQSTSCKAKMLAF